MAAELIANYWIAAKAEHMRRECKQFLGIVVHFASIEKKNRIRVIAGKYHTEI